MLTRPLSAGVNLLKKAGSNIKFRVLRHRTLKQLRHSDGFKHLPEKDQDRLLSLFNDKTNRALYQFLRDFLHDDRFERSTPESQATQINSFTEKMEQISESGLWDLCNLKTFQSLNKQEQDSLLWLSWTDPGGKYWLARTDLGHEKHLSTRSPQYQEVLFKIILEKISETDKHILKQAVGFGHLDEGSQERLLHLLHEDYQTIPEHDRPARKALTDLVRDNGFMRSTEMETQVAQFKGVLASLDDPSDRGCQVAHGSMTGSGKGSSSR